MENISVSKKRSYSKSQIFGFILGIVLFLLINFGLPITGLSKEGIAVLAVLALMASWWISEAVNTAITGLLPLILFPLTGAMSASSTAAAYGSNTIFMFFGGFAISLALERWNLHHRIALSIINFVGTSVNRLILGLLFTGGFLSMWVSNTATILMLLPIATAIAGTLESVMKQKPNFNQKNATNFKKSAIFAVGFGAIIGGSTTIIGTPTNMILSGLTSELLNYDIAFGKFMMFMLPLSILQYIIMFIVLTKVVYRVEPGAMPDAKDYIKSELEKLGDFSKEEIIVSIVFISTVFMWLMRTVLFSNISGLSDTVISIIAAVVLFALPNTKGSRILDGDSIAKMPWTVVLMLMGGMAIAAGFSNTDLATYLGGLLLNFENTSFFGLVVIVTAFGLIMTQVAPNTASATILIPIAFSLAQSVNVPPLYLMMAASFGTGFATTLPSGTPLMGIMYGTGEFKISELSKVGAILAFFSMIFIVLLIYFLAPVVFGV